MKRNYIGLSCTGHDNALAIVSSRGELVFAEAAERYLQNKRALDAPPDDLLRIRDLVQEYCEPDAELVPCLTWSNSSDSLFAGYRNVLGQGIASLLERRATSSERTRRAIDLVVGRQRGLLHLAETHQVSTHNAGRNLRYVFPERATRARGYDHHRAHAAAACYTSPYDKALCVVVDGVGEGTATACFSYADGVLVPIADPSPASACDLVGLGMFYADLCTLCGFDHWKGEEWKVMGLAAYGADDPELVAHLKQCLANEGLNFRRPSGEVLALQRILQTVATASDTTATRAALARAGQRVFEEALVSLCRRVRELVPCDNLVLTGGCALNSSANGKLLETTGFTRLYVPSAPADDGNAVGAALLGYLEDHPHDRPRARLQAPYLGSKADEATLERAALRSGFRLCERFDGSASLCSAIAERLVAGEIVGWMQGRAELGPRALGNRSILADPRRVEVRDRLNKAVKLREDFRPFAPAILAEQGDAWFESYQESPYMERTLRWRKDAATKVPAVVHVDGTGRLQTVKRVWNPLFYDLIDAFFERSGVPILLNTSFNIMGKPIVHSVEDALAVFATTDIDVLAIESFVFTKK